MSGEGEARFRDWLRARTISHGERKRLSLILRPTQRNWVSKYLKGEPKTIEMNDAIAIAKEYRVSLDAIFSTKPPKPSQELAKLIRVLEDVEAADKDGTALAEIRALAVRYVPSRRGGDRERR